MRAPMRPLAMLSRLATAALFTLSLARCGGDEAPSAETAAPGSGQDDITNVTHTTIKDQSIGNCWIYATVGWAESLHLRATGEALNLSESYVTYWHWYEQIANTKTAPKLDSAGLFDIGTLLMEMYGMVDEGVFIADEATRERSSAQSRAEAAINASLTSGVLSKKRDPRTVRDELNKAFGLSADVAKKLDELFGPDSPRFIDDVATLPKGFYRPTEFMVSSKTQGGELTTRTMSEEIPAWERVVFPTSTTDRRRFFRRVQKAMADGQPVVIFWNVDFNALDRSAGGFAKLPSTPGHQGSHITLLEDYEAYDVPNLGVLPAGQLVESREALDALLADQTKIKFLRIKNSWGTGYTGDPSKTGEFKGYVDLYADYLTGKMKWCGPEGGTSCTKTIVPLDSVWLPKSYDTTVPSGVAADACKGRSDNDYCRAKIATSATGSKRLQSCKGGVTVSSKECATSCTAGTSTKPAVCSP